MSLIQLRSSHLHISAEIVQAVFKDENNVFISYQQAHGALFIVPASAQWFPKMHKANQGFLKMRNLKGDKTLPLHEVLIDYTIDDQNRELKYEWRQKSGVLKIYIKPQD